MKLLFGTVSPFVRKVMVSALELGVQGTFETVPSPLSALKPNPDVVAANPIGKIPVLLLDDGTSLFDSVVICEYLEATSGGNRLFRTGKERWRALRLHAIADGMLEAAMVARFETATRPDERQWPEWAAIQLSKVTNCLNRLEGEVVSFAAEPTIGEIALGCALGWIDFRMPELQWREGRPGLTAWFGQMAKRPSMAATVPK